MAEEPKGQRITLQQLTEALSASVGIAMAAVIDALAKAGDVRVDAVRTVLLARKIEHPDPIVRDIAEATIRNAVHTLGMSDPPAGQA